MSSRTEAHYAKERERHDSVFNNVMSARQGDKMQLKTMEDRVKMLDEKVNTIEDKEPIHSYKIPTESDIRQKPTCEVVEPQIN